jgi:hypothetical protein
VNASSISCPEVAAQAPLDQDTAEHFLTALDPGATRHTFQAFDDNSDRKGKRDLSRQDSTARACGP